MYGKSKWQYLDIQYQVQSLRKNTRPRGEINCFKQIFLELQYVCCGLQKKNIYIYI